MNNGDLRQDNERDRVFGGKSLRQKCFWWFDFGFKPVTVAQSLGVNANTVHRYYAQWKKMVPWFQLKYQAVRNCTGRLTYQDRKAIAETLANELGTSCDAVMEYMSQPWALKQLVNNEWRQWPVPQIEKKSRGNINKLMDRLFSAQISEEANTIIDIALNPDFGPSDDYRLQ